MTALTVAGLHASTHNLPCENYKTYLDVTCPHNTPGQRIEVTELAQRLFPFWAQIVTFFCFILYTTGCLCAYATTITTTVVDLIMPLFQHHNATSDAPIAGEYSLFGQQLDQQTIQSDLYYLILVVFAVVVTPLCFGNFQNTRYLQVVIVVIRFSAYLLMLVVPMIFVFTVYSDGGSSVAPELRWNTSYVLSELPMEFYFNAHGISSVYGNTIFSFMLHHSIPGLLSPVRPERGSKRVLFIAFFSCAVMYIALCTFANFAFYPVGGHAVGDSVAGLACRAVMDGLDM